MMSTISPRRGSELGPGRAKNGTLLVEIAVVHPSHEIDTSFLGEHLFVSERLVISPATGVFWPAPECPAGGEVDPGTCFGTVAAQPVSSSFSGRLMGMLAHAGERVQTGQPIAWLRVEESSPGAAL